MAEEKKKKTPAKTTAKKSPAVKSAKAKKTEPKSAKKETTKVMAQPARFGDSLLDEIILLLIIVVSIVVFISLLTDQMGIIGAMFSSLFKGLLGFAALPAPAFVIVYCIWMLADKDRTYPVVRAIGAALFLLTVSSAAQVMNPTATGGLSFLKKCALLYGEGAFSNGGLLGGLLGGALYSALDTLGSVIVLMTLLIISTVMATGKSFFRAIGDANTHRKARRKVRNEKIKNKAERIRQQEILEEEKLARKAEHRKKIMAKEDFNIELMGDDKAEPAKETRYVKETVFRKKPMELKAKKREPIFDFVKENEVVLDAKEIDDMGKTVQPRKRAAEAAASAANHTEPKEAVQEKPETSAFDDTAPIIDIVSVEDAPAEEDIPIIEMAAPETEPAGEEMQEETVPAPVEAVEETAETVDKPKTEAAETPEDVEIFTEPMEEEKPYVFPPIELLGKDPQTGSGGNRSEMIENARKLESTLKSFGVDAKVVQISKGPTVTRYELSPSQGVKVSKIVNLADDIALNLAASGIRIEAPIPGKAAVGIEVPNKETQSVYMRTLLESDAFKEHPSKLAFALGQDIAGNPVVTDIAKMPHLLIAGATGSGKSVCINTLITSILYKADPREVKLLLVDPKVVELSVYNGIPHLLIPVVTDPKKASSALNWAVREMLQRYNDFAAHGVRDIKGFNKMMEEKGDEKGKMPQIVIIIDELADLMMAAPGEVEDSICRLAQMARAAGMHLIIATQRPSVDVITGVIKANIPSRLAFAVSSGIDSRTILDMVGAEKLLGKGDMLFHPAGQGKPNRLQGAFVTDQEVEALVDFLKQTSKPYYNKETIDQITSAAKAGGDDGEEADEFYGQAVDLILEKEKASVSMLQRQFRIGYNRAARLMDDLERRGIVGPEEGSKPRKVLITKSEWEEMTGSVPEEI